MCWGEGERETQEVSLAVKNSPYAIWANRCKAECNKIQVWEITPRVWGGKIISAAFFFLFFLCSPPGLIFFFSLFVFFACYRADSSPVCMLTSSSPFLHSFSVLCIMGIVHAEKSKNSDTAVLSAVSVSFSQAKKEIHKLESGFGCEGVDKNCLTHFGPPTAPNTHIYSLLESATTQKTHNYPFRIKIYPLPVNRTVACSLLQM